MDQFLIKAKLLWKTNLRRIISAIFAILVVAGGTYVLFGTAPSLETVASRDNDAQMASNTNVLWNDMHPDSRSRWAGESEYVAALGKPQSTAYASIKIKETTPVATWTDPLTGKVYTGVQSVTSTYTPNDGASSDSVTFYQKVNGRWYFFSSLLSGSDRVRIQASAVPGPDYKELSKSPDVYKGTIVKYDGKIVQIQQDADGNGYMRLSLAGNLLDDIVYVTYSGSTTALDGDTVTVYGILNGSVTYTSQANYQITIPSLAAVAIESPKTAAGPPNKQPQNVSVPVATSKPVASPRSSPAPSPYCSTQSDCDGFKVRISFDEDPATCAITGDLMCKFSNPVDGSSYVYYVTVAGDTIGGMVKSRNQNTGAETDYHQLYGTYDKATGEMDFGYSYWVYPNIMEDFVDISSSGKISGSSFLGDWEYKGTKYSGIEGLVTSLPITVADEIPKKGCSIKGDRDHVSGGIKTYYLPTAAAYHKIDDPIAWFCTESDASAAGFEKSLK